MCVGKAYLLSDHFDIKQSKESVDLPLTCHLSYHLCLQVERGQASLVRLGPFGGTDPLGMFPPLLERTVDVMATSLSVVFLAACSSG